MNRPFDKIHDPLSSWGRLLIPWFGKDQEGRRRWLAWFDIRGASHKKRLKKTDKYGFHNCRLSGG